MAKTGHRTGAGPSDEEEETAAPATTATKAETRMETVALVPAEVTDGRGPV